MRELRFPQAKNLGQDLDTGCLTVFCVPSSTMLLPTNNETHAMHPKELTQWGEVCCDEETISSCVPVWEPVSKIHVKTKDLALE